MNIRSSITNQPNTQFASTALTASPKSEAQEQAAPSDSFTFGYGEGGGGDFLMKAAQGAAIGYVNHSLGGGAWKSGFVGGAIKGASYYIQGRIAGNQAVKNGDLPGGLGVGSYMGQMGATVGFVSGFPAFTVGAAVANLCGGGVMAHAISGAVVNVMTP